MARTLSEVVNRAEKMFNGSNHLFESAYDRAIRAEAVRREFKRMQEGRPEDAQAYQDALIIGRVRG